MQAPLNQNLVRQYKAQWLPNINNHTNFHFDLNVDPREKMQALYELLQNFQVDAQWLTSLWFLQEVQKANGNTDDVKVQYFINGNTLNTFKHMIDNFNPNRNASLDYQDSGTNANVMRAKTKRVGMRFIRAQSRLLGGFWPYLNKTDIDLSIYGIYKEFDENNYKENCLVKALYEASKIQSLKPLSDDRLELLKNSMNMRLIPYKDLTQCAKLLQHNILLYVISDDLKTIRKYMFLPDQVIRNPSKENLAEFSYYNIILFQGHYMINEPISINVTQLKHWNSPKTKNIETNSVLYIGKVLKILLENDAFEPMTMDQLSVCYEYKPASFHHISNILQTKEDYLNMKLKIYEGKIKYVEIDPEYAFAQFDEKRYQLYFGNIVHRRSKALYLDNYPIKQADEILTNLFGYPLYLFTTIASYSEYILRYFIPCKPLDGGLQEFIRKCLHGGQYGMKPAGKYHLEDQPFVKIDLNSAYTSAMVNMKIPYNYPKTIKKEEFDINSEKVQFLQIKVTKVVPNEKFIVRSCIQEPGEYFISNIRLRCCIGACHEFEFEFIDGQEFEIEMNDENEKPSFIMPDVKCTLKDDKRNIYEVEILKWEMKQINPNFADLLRTLYNCRFQFKECSSIFKNILNSIYGKSVALKENTKKKVVPKENVEEFELDNFDLIFSSSKVKYSKKYVTYEMIRPIVYKKTKPQFGVLIVDYILERMFKIEKWCHDNDLDGPYLLCVDSFILPYNTFSRYCEEFNQKENSVELGEFKIENPLGRFDLIIVSKRNWLLYDAKIPWNQIYYRATNKVLKYCFNGRSNSDIINAFKIALKDISK